MQEATPVHQGAKGFTHSTHLFSDATEHLLLMNPPVEIPGLGKCLDLELKWEGINFTLGGRPPVILNGITTLPAAKLRCLQPLSAAV